MVIMERKLLYNVFENAYELVKFINMKEIKQEDIQQILNIDYEYELFYWGRC